MRASIVIINYNYARFLRQAIESALAQTHEDTEVVVVDDGSLDNSSEIIRSYGDRIISVIKNNAGQSSCYSRGFSACSGDLVLFLDADDYLRPYCLSEVIGIWKEGYVKAHFYLDVVDESGASLHAVVPSGRLRHGTDPLKMMRLFGAYCSPPASGNIYSRTFLTRILPMENESQLWNGGADSVPIFAAPYFGTIAAVPRSLGFYRRHADASGGVTVKFHGAASLRKLEREHQKDLLRDHSWRLAVRQTTSPRLVEPSRLKRRMCYLRLTRSSLDPADNRFNLLVRGIVSAIKWDAYSWTQKIAITGWFLGMAILPLHLAENLIRPALGITNRTTRLRGFLKANRR
jgi:hypothetical protein